MPIGFWYWLILVLVVLFGIWGYVPDGPHPWYRSRGWHLWLLLLLIIIGWHDFGAPWAALVR
jgi:hypothetical protein